jgi:hypothetical protein
VWQLLQCGEDEVYVVDGQFQLYNWLLWRSLRLIVYVEVV